jgi:hypothetical protein
MRCGQLSEPRERHPPSGGDRKVGHVVLADLGEAVRRQHDIKPLWDISQPDCGAAPTGDHGQLLALSPLQDSRHLLHGLRAYDGAGDKAIDSILLRAPRVCLTQLSADERFEGCKPYRSCGHGSSAAPLSPPLAP